MTAPPFLRRVELETLDAHTVRATIEDYNHHFEVTLRHDGERAVAFSTEAVRSPWSPCADAAGELAELVGRPIGVRPRSDSPDRHCTHQLDVACIAVRFAGLGLPWRRYDVTITGYDQPEEHAEVVRDDGYRLAWTVVGNTTIASPEPYAGRLLGKGFASFARTLEPDEAEAAFVLRRAAWMAMSRSFSLDAFATLDETGLGVGVCYAAQAHRRETARRNRGMARVELQQRPRN